MRGAGTAGNYRPRHGRSPRWPSPQRERARSREQMAAATALASGTIFGGGTAPAPIATTTPGDYAT
eukprot:12623036-Heterocapsa_arctica.AAC.1